MKKDSWSSALQVNMKKNGWGKTGPLAFWIAKLLPLLLIPILFYLTILLQIVPAPDWYHMFRPAALAFLSSGNPYVVSGYFNPPWALLGYLPIALLPPALSASVFTMLEMAVILFAAIRFGAKPLGIALLFLSPFTIQGILLSNLDMYVALGLTLPPVWGLFLVLLKPQMSIGLVIYWLAAAWRKGKLNETVRVFGPVTAAFLVSFLIYGIYFLRASKLAVGNDNLNFWPYCLPFGIALLVWSIYKQQLDFAAFSGFLITPYLSIASVWLALFVLIRRPKILLVAVILSWPLFILFARRYY
jgi:hypothetical protein